MGTSTTKEPAKAKRRGAYFLCITCGDEFYAFPSYIKKCKARGSLPKYCGMKCYDKSDEKNPFFGKAHTDDSIKKMSESTSRSRFKSGEGNPNFTRFGEEFVGKSFHWIREKIFKTVGRCQHCGIDDHRLLTVHHKDRNRKNNDITNLVLLCWNCHALEHWKGKDGMYHFMRRKVVTEDEKRNLGDY